MQSLLSRLGNAYAIVTQSIMGKELAQARSIQLKGFEHVTPSNTPMNEYIADRLDASRRVWLLINDSDNYVEICFR